MTVRFHAKSSEASRYDIVALSVAEAARFKPCCPSAAREANIDFAAEM